MTATVEELVKKHDRFACGYAWQTMRSMGMAGHAEDLIAEARVGLVVAAQHFDPEKGFTFLTYAKWWIRRYVHGYAEAMQRVYRIPNGGEQRTATMRVTKSTKALRDQLGREPTIEEIAEHAQCAPHRIELARNFLASRQVYMSTTDAFEDDGSIGALRDESEAQDVAVDMRARDSRIRAALERAMERLTPKEQEIVRRRGLADEPESMRVIAKEWGVTHQRVQQVEAIAIGKIRRALKWQVSGLLREVA